MEITIISGIPHDLDQSFIFLEGSDLHKAPSYNNVFDKSPHRGIVFFMQCVQGPQTFVLE